MGLDEFYAGPLAGRLIDYLRSQGSVVERGDFADFQPEVVDPISTDFDGLVVSTSPANTHGFLLLRALRGIAELGIDEPCGAGLGSLLRLFHRGNELRAAYLADPRFAEMDLPALVGDGLAVFGQLGRDPGSAARWCPTATPSVSPQPTVTGTPCR